MKLLWIGLIKSEPYQQKIFLQVHEKEYIQNSIAGTALCYVAGGKKASNLDKQTKTCITNCGLSDITYYVYQVGTNFIPLAKWRSEL